MNLSDRTTGTVLQARIDAISWHQAVDRILSWGAQRQSRYVCACSVHSVVTASSNERFLHAVNQADMATPDGMPVAWSLRRLGFTDQQRINGPDLTWRLLQHAAQHGQKVFFYGSSEETLRRLRQKIEEHFAQLRIVGMIAPPFRTLSDAEDQAIIDHINSSGANLVFVGLGCPKQELWMAQHRGRIHAVMLGVGAAFDYHAGTLQRAPLWMQRNGLEWLYRLLKEPRRLWRRYLSTNTRFILGIALQLCLLRGNSAARR